MLHGAISHINAQELPSRHPVQFPRMNEGHKLQFNPHNEKSKSFLFNVFFVKISHQYYFLNSNLSTKFKILLTTLDNGPNFNEYSLKVRISSCVKNLTKINAKKYTIMQMIMPGNKNKGVFGMKNPTKPMIKAAATILAIGSLGALVLVSLNTKYIHGTIMQKQAMVVAVAPPAIPKYGTNIQQRAAVTTEPKIKIYIGILGFPTP